MKYTITTQNFTLILEKDCLYSNVKLVQSIIEHMCDQYGLPLEELYRGRQIIAFPFEFYLDIKYEDLFNNDPYSYEKEEEKIYRYAWMFTEKNTFDFKTCCVYVTFIGRMRA